jgi:hypothetical protein
VVGEELGFIGVTFISCAVPAGTRVATRNFRIWWRPDLHGVVNVMSTWATLNLMPMHWRFPLLFFWQLVAGLLPFRQSARPMPLYRPMRTISANIRTFRTALSAWRKA